MGWLDRRVASIESLPYGVIVEPEGGHWGTADIQERSERGVRTMLRLLGST